MFFSILAPVAKPIVFDNLDTIVDPDPDPWDLMEAIEFIRLVYPIALKHKFYPALTGGLLYKEKVPRKDLDVVFYSNRQTRKPNRAKFLKELAKELDLKLTTKFNWLQKAKTKDGKIIDFFFPETRKTVDEEEYIT